MFSGHVTLVPKKWWVTTLDALACVGGVDLKLMAAGEASKHLRDFASLCFVDIVFPAVSIHIVNGLDVNAVVAVINVFGDVLILPFENVKNSPNIPANTAPHTDFTAPR